MNRLLACLTIALVMAVGNICPAHCSASEIADTVTVHNSDKASCPQSVGLVLSGGGAKGIAHIGVIQALEDHNIPIDYIAGTSMGAIVGGLYASGYTPAEMMELILSKGFGYWSTGTIDPKLTYFYSEPEKTPAFVTIPIGRRDSTGNAASILPTSLINPLPMNFAFMELFSAISAQCGNDFNNLFVPFRCVTSNVYAKHKIVCRNGALGDAIRASMSFPLVFHPIEMDGVLVYDGGIYDNFPVDVMREDFAPSIMIGVDVSAPDKKPMRNDLIQQLEDMIIQNNDYSLPDDEGIRIKINLQEFSLLDFPKAKAIYDIGYRRAMEMMDSITTRVTARIPSEARSLRREVFKSRTPYLRFDSVHVTGGTPSQDRYLAHIFESHNHSDTFGITHARDAYYRAITPGTLRNFVPNTVYNPRTGLFDLNLRAYVREPFRAGFGGYISSSTSSMLFASLSYNTLSFHSFGASINGWLGQSYMAATVNARINFNTHVPSYLRLEGVVKRKKYSENDHLFYDFNQPAFITNSEVFARLLGGCAVGTRGKFEAGAGVGHLTDRFYQTNIKDFVNTARDRDIRDLGQVIARYHYETLNDKVYPSAGASYKLTAMGVYGNSSYTFAQHTDTESETDHTYWGQVEAETRNYFTLGRHFSLGLEWSALVSTRKLYDSYVRSLVEAPTFNPTSSSYNSFNSAFRANSFTTLGVVPVVRVTDNFQLRTNLHLFLPLRAIEEAPDFSACYGRWLYDPEFFGEVAGVVHLPSVAITAYANYMTVQGRKWNFGLSLGYFFTAPRFLR
ncbi:MAG: patatin-like phospholipase family protein [Bacteroides sp.]|nr:patatin-like phospholipase family protein [Bacteroides sp.]